MRVKWVEHVGCGQYDDYLGWTETKTVSREGEVVGYVAPDGVTKAVIREGDNIVVADIDELKIIN